ncbi:TPA: hypothetical protein MCI44_005622, partial [Klebsiella pneumoniae]|nr:hypothetical protein [Klebsiella pneumoniae]
ISIQTGKSSQNNSVETDEMKNSKVGKLMVSSDFTFDFNSALKKITVKNEKLMTKLDKQDEKLQLIKLRLKIIVRNLKLLHGNKFHEEKETVNILKNKLIIESVLVHMLKVIILCNFEGSEADDIVPLKGKIENILFNFPDSIVFCDVNFQSDDSCNLFDNHRLVKV